MLSENMKSVIRIQDYSRSIQNAHRFIADYFGLDFDPSCECSTFRTVDAWGDVVEEPYTCLECEKAMMADPVVNEPYPDELRLIEDEHVIRAMEAA